MDDWDLLNEYATGGSDHAFTTIVEKYMPLVYSSAQRRAGSAHAEDITQAVFIILARKAPKLRRGKAQTLAGWLFRTTRFAASESLRRETRRQERERRTEDMEQMAREQRDDEATWADTRPVLDAAMDSLSRKDREAVLLRYFHDASYSEVGTALGLSENAATKRTARALEKLHGWLNARGVALSIPALASMLTAESVSAVPAGVIAGCTAAAMGSAAAVGGGATAGAIADGTTKMILTLQLKTAGIATCAALTAGAGAVATVKAMMPVNPDPSSQIAASEPFPLVYKARSRLPDGSDQFQLNSADNRQTFFTGIGGNIEGFKVLSHRQMTEARSIPGMQEHLIVDISELTLERDGVQHTLIIDGREMGPGTARKADTGGSE